MEKETLRRIERLQAYVRGYLVRKAFLHLREDYESVVKEIEGHCHLLRWEEKLLSKPGFFHKNPIKLKPGIKDDRNVKIAQEPERDMTKTNLVGSQIATSSLSDAQFGNLLDHVPVQAAREPYKTSHDPGRASEDDGSSVTCTDITSLWNSTALESGANVIKPMFPTHREMPTNQEGLHQYRNNLAMELLWIQQAIVSRKNYLVLKQRLGSSRLTEQLG
ncbi:IQ domain-containing protein C [Latimeria chalumnae]|uniref:IQ domain-containing protein C n=1 Tax=Latimeria chalumnae TaxID=7897 RepID=UPI0003C11CF4|nr:PREDICTED: IQ domain-containing protein C [Latimeria chalumnae]|eukprot:XP_006003297.1 PREDICTED: IQ domain-containing protein C [Latimeria chalumnae]